MKGGSFLRLMRFDKPVGILLLWFPTAWALWLANGGMPSFALLLYFLLGTVCMRSAGCVVNDIADRHIDTQVKRTRSRPLATGEVGLLDALGLLVVLLLAALLIVIQLPVACFYYALIALLITVTYPFCKRFLEAPQLVLGIAFSMGIPMAFAASGTAFTLNAYLLFILNAAWIVSYDTMYAMVDKAYDLRIGVKSTAIWFGEHDRVILTGLQGFFHGLWLVISYALPVSTFFYIAWGAGGMVLFYQQRLIATREPDDCFKAFISNYWYGGIMWIAVIS